MVDRIKNEFSGFKPEKEQIFEEKQKVASNLNENFAENYWDFFEMFEFIHFIRVSHPDVMANMLKAYKGGRFS